MRRSALIEIGLFQDRMFVREKRSVLKRSSAAFGMAGEIVVRAVRNTFHFVELLFFFTLRKESIKKIRCCLCVMGKLFGLLRVLFEILYGLRKGFSSHLIVERITSGFWNGGSHL